MSRTSPEISWTIRVESAVAQAHTFACQNKDGCFVSAHTKLAGFGKHVALSTEKLADTFRTAIYPTMRKRHGDSVELILLKIQTLGGGKVCKIDDEIVLARIRDRNFAPNVAAIK